jgi:hypothetical protein
MVLQSCLGSAVTGQEAGTKNTESDKDCPAAAHETVSIIVCARLTSRTEQQDLVVTLI